MKTNIDLIDINKKKGFPRTYRFSRLTRWMTILLALLAISYAVWFILTSINAETTMFKKIIPFVVIFLAGNSLTRNLFSLNSLTFREESIKFGYLLFPNKTIRWEQITKLNVYQGKVKALILHYKQGDAEKKLFFTMVFPNMLEIINAIAEMCPQLEYDDFLKNIIIAKPLQNK